MSLRPNRQMSPGRVPENWAGVLLEFAICVRRQVRSGARLEAAATRLRSTVEYCALAMAFAGSSDLLKLRAMVEDWSLDRIADTLGLAPLSWDVPERARIG